nr:hypothetical protein BaRGS_025041 [Batillaria attramentaria]
MDSWASENLVPSVIVSSSTCDLVKRLSDVYLGSLTFRLFDASMNDSSDVTLTDRMREHLQTVKESHFSNILLVASHNTAEMVLAEARNYGLLSRRYFWLVVLPDDRCSNVRNLVAGNETNVLLIQPVAPGIDPTKACYKPAKPCNANETYDQAKPFVQKKVVDNKTTFEGFCIDILEELAQKLKFRYEFVEPEDKEWGAPADNGSGWTGVVGMVLRKEVDMGVGPVTITSIREAVIDFTKPFMEDGIGILTKRPNSDSKNMFKMFTPLTPQVWGAVAGAVVLVSVCLYVRMKCKKCLVGFWWLFTILMTSTYTANLAAFLTVTIQDTPINSLNELATSSDLKPLVKTGSNIHTLFMEAEDGVYQDIWNKMGGMPKVTSNNESLSHVLTGSYAYMTDASQLEYIMLKDCTTYSLAKELFNTGGFGFVLQEDAPYMEVINYNIMKMHEAGLVDKWRQRWWSSPDPCTNTDRTSAAKKLDWPSLSGLFYIFLGTASVSILFRFLEFWLQGEKISRFCDDDDKDEDEMMMMMINLMTMSYFTVK